jgi:hypothetical protein
MWPFALATLRSSLTSWAVWLILLTAVGVGWLGLEVSVLALGESESQAPELILTTAQAFGALLALWIVARTLDDDGRAGFTAPADQTRPGPGGRILGRWMGAFLAGAVGGVVIHCAIARELAGSLSLYTAIIVPPLVLSAWGALLGCRGGGGLVVGGGGALWFLGHLPWGSPSFASGLFGRGLAAWLPGPVAPAETLAHAGYTAAAVGGLLLLALALAPRPGAAD